MRQTESLFQEHAFESSQKYKEGKFIIELAHMIKENGWDWNLARPSPSSPRPPVLCSSCVVWRLADGQDGPPGTSWSAGSSDNILLNSLVGDARSLVSGDVYTWLKWGLFWVKVTNADVSRLERETELNTMTWIVDVDVNCGYWFIRKRKYLCSCNWTQSWSVFFFFLIMDDDKQRKLDTLNL